MGNLIIKGKGGAGNKLIIQDQAGGAVLTTADAGATIASGVISGMTGIPAAGVTGVLPPAVTGGSGLTTANLPAFHAKSTTQQSWTGANLLQLETKDYDSGGCYNNSGSNTTLNGRSVRAWNFGPNIAGYYFLYCAGAMNNINNGNYSQVRIRDKDDNVIVNTLGHASHTQWLGTSCQIVVSANGTTDEWHVHISQDTGSSKPTVGPAQNCFGGFLIART